jgi:hypothetical protein
MATGAEVKGKPAAKPLLIVAPQALEPALHDYIEFKKRNLPTRFETLEHVLASVEGADDPEKLKRFVYNTWEEHHLGYLLLVGDRDVMPLRYITSLKFSTFDYLFLPTDLYYADLARDDGSFDDWNADQSSYHQGYFGEVSGEKGTQINRDQIHYRPQIAVGRWPVSTDEKVRIIAQKSMDYEKSILDGTHPALRKAAIFHVRGWVDARDQLGRISHSLPPGWNSTGYLFQDDNPKYKLPEATEESVIRELNSGVALCIHAGHGEPEGWMGYPLRTGNHVNTILSTYHSLPLIKNADKLPLFISIGCSTSYFAPLGPGEPYIDTEGKSHVGAGKKEIFSGPPPAPSPYQSGKLAHESLAKRLLEDGPDGAVAYIGADMVAQNSALSLLDGFITAMRTTYQPRIGECWSYAVGYYYNKEKVAQFEPDGDWVIPAKFIQPMKFNLFGDPSLPMAPTERRTNGP